MGTIPFFGYVAVFLIIPTAIVVIGAFRAPGGAFSWVNILALGDSTVIDAFVASVVLSAVTAAIGAVFGGLLAYVLVTGRPGSISRRIVTAVCSVLAQFGGVMLAFAFIATLGSAGMISNLLRDWLGVETTGAYLYTVPGLILVYTYFQIPLMVIVFLPAVDGIRAQWREATETLGGSTWVYWRRVAGPLLAPAFLGSLLLLFANAFSAYATAAALVTQSTPIVPLKISGAITNEVNVGHADLAKSLALGMVIIVAIVMWLYALLQKRTAKWLG
ncbi:MAG: ABC transporter permease [Actinobacteria bacterium 69-20]|nr:MAG: ABC transporter permease [Actinobacteria bacterium 69-20]